MALSELHIPLCPSLLLLYDSLEKKYVSVIILLTYNKRMVDSVPALDEHLLSSSTRANEQMNKLLLWEILVSSPDILTFTLIVPSALFLTCKRSKVLDLRQEKKISNA